MAMKGKDERNRGMMKADAFGVGGSIDSLVVECTTVLAFGPLTFGACAVFPEPSMRWRASQALDSNDRSKTYEKTSALPLKMKILVITRKPCYRTSPSWNGKWNPRRLKLK